MEDLFLSLGLWNWVIVGFILLLLELIVPGVFFVWLGIGALLTALVCAVLASMFLVGSWETQILLFLAFSIVMVFIGRNFFRRDKETDQPLLNQRTAQIIGQVITLAEPIMDGYGRVRIDDTIWRITGPDLPAGTRVRLTAFANGAFCVEAA